METQNYCSKCKETELPLIKYSRRGDKQYYYCTVCNTERAKKYRNTEVGKGNIYKAVYRSIKKLLYKQQARNILNTEIRKGTLTRPISCGECGITCKPHGHYTDYTAPLVVKWLCRSCHAQEHRITKEQFSTGTMRLT